MLRQEPNIFVGFLNRYLRIKSLVSNEPCRIQEQYRTDAETKASVDDMFMFMRVVDFEKRVFHSTKKYHSQTPLGFEKHFSEYKKFWESEIYTAMFGELDLSVLDELDYEGSSDNEVENDNELHAPNPETEQEFDPLIHNGSEALSLLLLVAQANSGFVGTEHASESHRASKIGLEAFDYLTTTIGLDVEGTFRRWRNVRVIFIPSHVSNRHGNTERGSLYELIDDAIRAYVFGAYTAAIASCRTVLETVLKAHYEIDYKFVDGEGKTRDKGLGKLIILADEKYKFVQGPRLRRLTDKANEVMHRYVSRDKVSEQDEKVILEFLITLKYMIERAPNTGT